MIRNRFDYLINNKINNYGSNTNTTLITKKDTKIQKLRSKMLKKFANFYQLNSKQKALMPHE